MLKKAAEHALETAIKAGEAILPYYHKQKDLDVEYKSDNSPLTAADKASHEVIFQALSHYRVFDQVLPVLSEESDQHSAAEKLSWKAYWCIDPLDGTKEFLTRSNEFTVNIALIDNHRPILGVIYTPLRKLGYMAWQGGGAYRCTEDHVQAIQVKTPPNDPLRIIVSRRHGIEKVKQALSVFKDYQLVNRGSALKFCEVAQGGADLFFRLTQTGEWDNAAGQCIVEEAGGSVFHLDFSPVRYNMSLSFKTQPLIVVGDSSLPWQEILKK